MATKILPCTCHYDFQDKTYGKGNRVFNLTAKKASGQDNGVWRCTVCLRQVESSKT